MLEGMRLLRKILFRVHILMLNQRFLVVALRGLRGHNCALRVAAWLRIGEGTSLVVLEILLVLKDHLWLVQLVFLVQI
jgi:hypothetical protein